MAYYNARIPILMQRVTLMIRLRVLILLILIGAMGLQAHALPSTTLVGLADGTMVPAAAINSADGLYAPPGCQLLVAEQPTQASIGRLVSLTFDNGEEIILDALQPLLVLSQLEGPFLFIDQAGKTEWFASAQDVLAMVDAAGIASEIYWRNAWIMPSSWEGKWVCAGELKPWDIVFAVPDSNGETALALMQVQNLDVRDAPVEGIRITVEPEGLLFLGHSRLIAHNWPMSEKSDKSVTGVNVGWLANGLGAGISLGGLLGGLFGLALAGGVCGYTVWSRRNELQKREEAQLAMAQAEQAAALRRQEEESRLLANQRAKELQEISHRQAMLAAAEQRARDLAARAPLITSKALNLRPSTPRLAGSLVEVSLEKLLDADNNRWVRLVAELPYSTPCIETAWSIFDPENLWHCDASSQGQLLAMANPLTKDGQRQVQQQLGTLLAQSKSVANGTNQVQDSVNFSTEQVKSLLEQQRRDYISMHNQSLADLKDKLVTLEAKYEALENKYSAKALQVMINKQLESMFKLASQADWKLIGVQNLLMAICAANPFSSRLGAFGGTFLIGMFNELIRAWYLNGGVEQIYTFRQLSTGVTSDADRDDGDDQRLLISAIDLYGGAGC